MVNNCIFKVSDNLKKNAYEFGNINKLKTHFQVSGLIAVFPAVYFSVKEHKI